MQFTKVIASLALVASINAKFHNTTGAAAGNGTVAGGSNSTGGAGSHNGTGASNGSSVNLLVPVLLSTPSLVWLL